MTLKGDFCYIIWFDNREDAHHWLKIMSRFTYAWMISRYALGEWAVVWDIGKHV